MRITEVTYARLKKTAQFENERVEARAIVNDDDDPKQVLAKVRAFVNRELGLAPTKKTYERAKQVIADYEIE